MEDFVIKVVRLLKRENIRYLVIGGFAGVLHSKKTSTSDLDILIENSTPNILNFQNIIHSPEMINQFRKGNIIRIIGKPFNIDFHPKIDGVETHKVFKNSISKTLKGEEIKIISSIDLEINLETTKFIIEKIYHA